MESLPNELLYEIGLHTLALQDFKSPFCHRDPNILLLFKRWLGVTRPIFYRTVVVRSSSAAKLLAETLLYQPWLANHIDRIRFNGGYGPHSRDILLAVPRVSHLCLVITRDLRAPGSARMTEMCKVLDVVNPRRVTLLYQSSVNTGKISQVASGVLRRSRFESEMSTVSLSVALAMIRNCIESVWTNMTEFDLPAEFQGTHIPMVEESRLMAKSLRKAPSLALVRVYRGDVVESPLRILSGNPSLQAILSKKPVRNLKAYQTAVEACPLNRLHLVHFPGEYQDPSLDDPFTSD